jgi:hypothetical protein
MTKQTVTYPDDVVRIEPRRQPSQTRRADLEQLACDIDDHIVALDEGRGDNAELRAVLNRAADAIDEAIDLLTPEAERGA